MSVTPAQFRLLRRLARGAQLHARYHNVRSSGTIRALIRKQCLAMKANDCWALTKFAHQILSGKGKARWNDEAYVL